MTDLSPAPAVALDGAIVSFLLRVVDQFETLVTDPEKLLATLRGSGWMTRPSISCSPS